MNIKLKSKTTAGMAFSSFLQLLVKPIVQSSIVLFRTIRSLSLNSFTISALLTASVSLSAIHVERVEAHQQKMAITTVLFNPRTQNLEVAHRFNLHDAEHAVKEIFGGSADILNSEKTQSDFAKYVVERFAIYNLSKTELPLSFVGTELEGNHFWVYQEMPAPTDLSGLYIQHNALRDIWHKQTNTINVEGMGDIKTLTFTDSTELLSVEFTHH